MLSMNGSQYLQLFCTFLYLHVFDMSSLLLIYCADESYLSPNEYFGGGLYVISTGENDYRAGIVDMELTAEEVKKQLVPEVINITYATVKVNCSTKG